MIHNNQSYSKREKRDGGVAGRVPREEGQQGRGGVRGLAIKARVPTLSLMFSVNEPPASSPPAVNVTKLSQSSISITCNAHVDRSAVFLR